MGDAVTLILRTIKHLIEEFLRKNQVTPFLYYANTMWGINNIYYSLHLFSLIALSEVDKCLYITNLNTKSH